MEGLVLIDEIDLYLHPTWQARFIPALRRVFPRMQFVATTHSPVVLSSLAPHEVVRLVVDEETGDIVQGGWDRQGGQFRPGVQDAEHQPDPRLMTGGELYRTWFGLEGMTPNPLGEKLRRSQVLSAHPAPTAAQARELRELRSEVRREFIQRLGRTEGPKAFSASRRPQGACSDPHCARSRAQRAPAVRSPAPGRCREGIQPARWRVRCPAGNAGAAATTLARPSRPCTSPSMGSAHGASARWTSAARRSSTTVPRMGPGAPPWPEASRRQRPLLVAGLELDEPAVLLRPMQ